jgi:CRP/FNR family transcriptional regulator
MSQHSNNELRRYFENGEHLEFAKGEVILGANQKSPGLFWIVEGFVKVYSVNNRGEQYIHIIYGKEEVFPLTWLIDRTKRNVYYEALTKCKVWVVPQPELLEKIKTDSQLSFDVLSHVVTQFKFYSDRIDNLEFKFASERLVYRLLFLAGRFGVRQKTGILLQVPITQQVLANSINLSRESVTRELDKLSKRGLIAYDGRQIILTDIDAMTKLLRSSISPDWWGIRSIK